MGKGRKGRGRRLAAAHEERGAVGGGRGEDRREARAALPRLPALEGQRRSVFCLRRADGITAGGLRGGGGAGKWSVNGLASQSGEAYPCTHAASSRTFFSEGRTRKKFFLSAGQVGGYSASSAQLGRRRRAEEGSVSSTASSA